MLQARSWTCPGGRLALGRDGAITGELFAGSNRVWGRRAGLFNPVCFLPVADRLFVSAGLGRNRAGILFSVSGNVFGVAFSAPLARIGPRVGDKLTATRIEMNRQTANTDSLISNLQFEISDWEL